MPGSSYGSYDKQDLPDELRDYLDQYEKNVLPPIVMPKTAIDTQAQEDYIRQLKQLTQIELNKQRKHSEVEMLRREMREEMYDIKVAIRKIGILLDSDKPSDKMMREHKMLREAYQKYKMIEHLIIGNKD